MLDTVLLALALCVCLVRSSTVHYTARVANHFLQPDGFNRSGVLVNGQFPAPLISATKGDQLSVNVLNSLTNSTMELGTSVHWHGILQHRTAYADGVAFVTQCPIRPQKSFMYNFGLTNQAGTFWYHSHISLQYCDGLRGPLVIYDPDDPHRTLYDVDDESTIITIGDWYHLTAALTKLNRPPDTTVINGLGRYAGGPLVPLSIVNVQHGTRYRFRVLNIACFPFYTFSIDGHKLTVIGADGTSVRPVTVDSIDIHAGQRYSVVVHADQPVSNYWIRANPNLGTLGFENGTNSAILRYHGARPVDPDTTATTTNLLKEQDLRPLVPSSIGDKVDVALNLDIEEAGEFGNFTVNGVQYNPPPLPVLLQILSGKFSASDLLPEGSVYVLPRNKLVEISMPGQGQFPQHPVHLHGHSFEVIRSAGSSEVHLIDPPARDVVSLGAASDNVTIRFRTDNPGPWLLHCSHIDFHLQAGLAIVLAEAPEDQVTGPESQIIPPSWKQLCEET
ncbi:laccase [Punctularia strigosozonata HHB-11173 SS5]|uniref:laccase n=1 Tax=Punctularia strigosozonata (strain HHB-11173) TaxID=741275 RepID=UPI0004416AF4|nr:laccase [Punctularia strigosozonata HHB-11173 SS5]EIN06931.1 laccase [Punctularia strigosozonata HHB-11173 SS5]